MAPVAPSTPLRRPVLQTPDTPVRVVNRRSENSEPVVISFPAIPATPYTRRSNGGTIIDVEEINQDVRQIGGVVRTLFNDEDDDEVDEASEGIYRIRISDEQNPADN